MTSEAKAKTVMVVEDIPNLLELIAQMLDANEYKTIKAKDGQECLDKLREEIPDIILLDIVMPGLTTKEILGAIEKDRRLSKVKIIFLTAIHIAEAKEEGLLASHQVVDFIEKPFTMRRLIDAITKAIN